MHPRQLIETAGLLSLQSAELLRGGAALCSDALSEYWIASRCRIDCWGRSLRSLGHSTSAPPTEEAGDLLMQLSEEIALAEPLTRVVTAIGCVYDRRLSSEEAGPIGLNMLEAHREAAARLKALRYAWWPKDAPRSRLAQSLVSQAEHWTDALLAYVSIAGPVDNVAIDPTRLLEYAYDSQSHGFQASRASTQLLALALRASFAGAQQPALNPDLNRRIAGAAVALFGSEGFDSLGLTKPAWMLRVERHTDDTAALVDRLFSDEEPGAIRLPARWRI